MNSYKTFCFLLLILSLVKVWPSLSFSEEVSTLELDLETCIEYALSHHPSLEAAEAGRLSASFMVDAERAKFKPTLDLGLETGIVTGEPTGAFVLAKGIETTKIDPFGRYYVTELAFNYPLYQEGVFLWQVGPSVVQKVGIAEKAASFYDVTQENVIHEVSVAFITALKHLESKRVVEIVYHSRKEKLKETVQRFENELVSKEDLLAIEVQVAVAEASVRETENSLQLSLADLAGKMGLNPITPIVVAERSAPFERLPSKDKLVELSVKTRPEIALQAAKIKSARASLMAVRSQRLPEVDLISSFNYGDGYEFSANTSWLAALQLKLPLLDFGGRSSLIQGAKAHLLEQQNILFNTRNVIVFEVIEAYTDILNAESQMTLAEKQVEQATEGLRSVRSKFELELRVQSDVIEAEATLIEEENKLIQAKYEKRLGIANLRKAVGGSWM